MVVVIVGFLIWLISFVIFLKNLFKWDNVGFFNNKCLVFVDDNLKSLV